MVDRHEIIKSLKELRTEILPNILSSALVIKPPNNLSAVTPDAAQRSKLQLNILSERAITIISNVESYLLNLEKSCKIYVPQSKTLEDGSVHYQRVSELEKKRKSLIDEINQITETHKLPDSIYKLVSNLYP